MRPIIIKDASDILSCLNAASIIPSNLNFFSEGIPTLAKEVAWIRSILRRMKNKEEFVFSVFNCDCKQFIGTVGLHEIDWQNKNARVGIMIANEEFRGHGFAQEILVTLQNWAFDALKLNKVFMNFRADNEKMHRIAEELGYREVGTLRQEYFWKGRFLDFVRFESILEDYQKRTQSAP